jgi:dTMP kinase
LVLTLVLHIAVYCTRRYGGERYEKRELQTRVRQRFSELQRQDEQEGQVPWHIVNAAQSIEQVQEEINAIVQSTLERIEMAEEAPTLKRMWKGVIKGDSSNKEN